MLDNPAVGTETSATMRFLKTEAGTVVLWLAGIVLLAAVLFPWIHGTGKNLAAEAAASELSPLLESIGKSAGKADIGTYFSRALYASVLLTLPFFLLRLRKIRRSMAGCGALPADPPLPWKTRLTHLFSAFVLAAGVLWLLGICLEAAGAFTPETKAVALGKVIRKSLSPALTAGIIEEFLFRGLLLGVWLRIAKPGKALLCVSAIFAFVHFLQPPAGAVLADPSSPMAGFRLLGLIFAHFANPQFIAAELLLLFTLGLLLGATRLRTSALWFPIGLHAGLVFAFKSFNMLHEQADSPLRPLWIGETLRSGLFPLFTLILMGVVCHFTLRCRKASPETPRI